MANLDPRDIAKLTESLSKLETALNAATAAMPGRRRSGGGAQSAPQANTREAVAIAKTSKEMRAELKKLKDEIKLAAGLHKLNRAADAASRSRSISDTKQQLKEAKDNYAKMHKTMKETSEAETRLRGKSNDEIEKSSRTLGQTFYQLDKALQPNYDAFNKLNFSLNQSVTSQASILNGMLDGYGMENEAHDKYMEKILGATKSLELFKKTSDNSTNGLKTTFELTDAIDQLSKQAGAFEKVMKTTDQSIDQFVQHLSDLKTTGEILSEEQEKLLDLASSAGLLNNGIAASEKAFKAHVKEVKKEIIVIQKTAQVEMDKHKAMESLKEKFGGLTKHLSMMKNPMSLVISGLGLFAASLKGAWEQGKMIAQHGMGTGFLESIQAVKVAQLTLGISAESAAKIFQENARIIAGSGGDIGKFRQGLVQNQTALMKFGLGTEEAAQATVDFVGNAAKGGINVRDTNKLSKAVQQQTAAFGKMKVTSGITIAEFKALNDEMMNSEAVQMQLNGVAEQERLIRMNSMNELRQQFVNLGMSAEGAQKAMLTIQELGKEAVGDRFTEAAKAMGIAGQLGFKDAGKLGEMLRNADKGPETQELITAIVRDLDTKKMEAQSRGAEGAGAENLIDSQLKTLRDAGSVVSGMMDVARGMSLGADAKGTISDKEANRLTDISQIPDLMVMAMKLEGITGQAISDPIVMAIAGLGLALAGSSLFTGGGLGKLAANAGKAVAGAGGVSAGGAAGAAAIAVPAALVGSAIAGGYGVFSAADDISQKKKAKASGGNIGERTGWNDFGALFGLEPGSRAAKNLSWITELDEYDTAGNKLAQAQALSDQKAALIAAGATAAQASAAVSPSAPKPNGIISQPVNTQSNASSSTAQTGAMVVHLSEDTISQIVSRLDGLALNGATSNKLETEQRDFLALLVDSNEATRKLAEDAANGRPSILDGRLSSKLDFFQRK